MFITGTMPGKVLAGELVQLARQAKVHGFASLDPETLTAKDPFLAKGMRLVADGVEPQRIEELLRLESEILSDKRAAAERMFRLMGTYSPMFGLVGTLIGLINMLKGLTDPRAIGQGMSVALMATFYGVLLAGLIFLPLAGKVRTLELDERLQRDQIIAALLAMRLGQNPEYIRETIEVFSGTGTRG
jgi:chemotaxis protein MotA